MKNLHWHILAMTLVMKTHAWSGATGATSKQWGIVTFLDEESSPSRIYYPPSLITQRYE